MRGAVTGVATGNLAGGPGPGARPRRRHCCRARQARKPPGRRNEHAARRRRVV